MGDTVPLKVTGLAKVKMAMSLCLEQSNEKTVSGPSIFHQPKKNWQIYQSRGTEAFVSSQPADFDPDGLRVERFQNVHLDGHVQTCNIPR